MTPEMQKKKELVFTIEYSVTIERDMTPTDLTPTEARRFAELLDAWFPWIGADVDDDIPGGAQSLIDLHEALAVRGRAPDVLGALRELRCWIGQSCPAMAAGAQCETLQGALDLADAALAGREAS
jgi:hypothetical protein